MWGSYLACEKYSMPVVSSPGSGIWWHSLKRCEISQFFLKRYPHLLWQWDRGRGTHSDVPFFFLAAVVWCHFCCCLTSITSLPRTLCDLMTQLTDLAHFSTKTTSRCRRTSSSIGRSSTMTSTWKALQKSMEKTFLKCWGLTWVHHKNGGCIPRLNKLSRGSQKMVWHSCTFTISPEICLSKKKKIPEVNSIPPTSTYHAVPIPTNSAEIHKSILNSTCSKKWWHVFLALDAHLLELGACSSMMWTSLSLSGPDRTQPFDGCGST